jgi:hypothetical protein
MSAPISGQYGTLNIGASELIEVYFWSLSRKAAVHSRATNQTGGYKATAAGTKSGSGTIRGNLDPAVDVRDTMDVGDTVTAQFFISATQYIETDITIESLDVETDIDEGDIVGWEASFQTDGAWTSDGALQT